MNEYLVLVKKKVAKDVDLLIKGVQRIIHNNVNVLDFKQNASRVFLSFTFATDKPFKFFK
jgi:hypothetical protein